MFLEIKSLGLPAGTVVNLVFAVQRLEDIGEIDDAETRSQRQLTCREIVEPL